MSTTNVFDSGLLATKYDDITYFLASADIAWISDADNSHILRPCELSILTTYIGAATVTDSSVTSKLLTGYVSGAGTVAATDTILQAIQKLNGNDGLKANLAAPSFTGTVTVTTSTAANSLNLINTDNGAAGVVIDLFHNSGSPTVNDVTGKIKFTGKDTAGNTETYAEITNTIVSATSGGEGSTVTISNMCATVLTSNLIINELGNIGIGSKSPSPYSGVKFSLNGDIWNTGASTKKFIIGTTGEGVGVFEWDNSTAKTKIRGGYSSSSSITLPHVSGQASLVGINEDTPTATLHTTCNGTNTTIIQKLQSTQSSGDPALEITYQQKILTTNNTPQVGTIQTTASNYSYYIETDVIARRTAGGAAGDSCGYKLLGLFKNVSGTVTQVGTTDKTVVGESDAACDAGFDISGTAIRLSVTGITSVSYTWHAISRIRVLST